MNSRPSAWSPGVAAAAADLRWLLERGYPKKASIKLVGDRHRLEGASRQVLYRGVAAPNDALRRRNRLVRSGAVGGAFLGIDGHNVILTLANYLSGVPVFLSDDGVIRDIGSLHGRLHDDDVMNRCLDLTADAVTELRPREVLAVFDAPLSHSRDHAGRLRRRLAGIPGMECCRVEAVPSGDEALKSAGPEITATSDSAVIDAIGGSVFDLSRYILEKAFRAVFSEPG